MAVNRAAARICIVGTGYVGMACAIGFAELGHRVIGFDILAKRIADLQRGVTPYREDGIEAALRPHLAAGTIAFTNSLAAAVRGADFVVIAVGTPSRADGSADISAVERAVADVAAQLSPGATIVIRSTVPAGTTERLGREAGVPILYAPEFLREGSAVRDFLHPDRIVVGAAADDAALSYLALLEGLQRPAIVTAYRNAELIKVFSNAFLALKISFANEVASFCDAVDADALAVLRGVGEDRRIGPEFLQPGIGFGGPCFEKDLLALLHVATETGCARTLVGATLRVNEEQPRRIVAMLAGELGDLKDARIGVWGVAFKAGTDDVRDSIALRIVADLVARGARPVVYDPAVREDAGIGCPTAPSALAALEGADALLVLTEWPEFAEIPMWAVAARLRRRVVVDGRNVLAPEAATAAGLRYRGVGRRPSTIGLANVG